MEHDSFRDRLATADKKGKRLWVYPARPKGRLYRARTIVASFLLLLLFAGPFIKIGGQPLLLLDILNRRFVIFGFTFWPQDFSLFAIVAIALVFFVILFTAVFGRLFCGWICPQTVFLEMVFRRIEFWIEGGPAKQRQLSARSWDGYKLYKRVLKHTVFFIIAFIIGNTFLAYITGIENLLEIITDSPANHVAGLAGMLIFSFLFYGVFAWFREQACTLVCPYGRLQGVLIDNNSIVVAYDYNRGEPRQAIVRGEDRTGIGDCVECGACVNVCPTGIDIRNGTQLECVNCTACIDACNRTMRNIGLPEGLIRYSSEDILKGGRSPRWTGRIIIYSIALTLVLSALVYMLLKQTSVEATILRTPGMLYSETDDGQIRNLYSAKIISKSYDTIPIGLRLKEPSGGSITMIGSEIVLPPDDAVESAFFVNIPRDLIMEPSTMVVIEILTKDKVLKEITTSFMGPSGAKR